MWFFSLTHYNMHFRCMTGVCTWWWVRNTSLRMVPMKWWTESNIPLKSPLFRSANPRTRMSSLQRLCLHICESSTRLQWKSTSSSSMNMPEKYSYSSEDRKICTKHHNSRKNSSIVKVLSGHLQFGEVRMFLEHNVNCTLQTWAVVDVFPLGERKDGLCKFQNTVLFQRLVHINLISDPLVYVQKDNFVSVLNDADIKNL